MALTVHSCSPIVKHFHFGSFPTSTCLHPKFLVPQKVQKLQQQQVANRTENFMLMQRELANPSPRKREVSVSCGAIRLTEGSPAWRQLSPDKCSGGVQPSSPAITFLTPFSHADQQPGGDIGRASTTPFPKSVLWSPEHCCNHLSLPRDVLTGWMPLGTWKSCLPFQRGCRQFYREIRCKKIIAQCDGPICGNTSRASVTTASLARATWDSRSEPHPSVLSAQICANLD